MDESGGVTTPRGSSSDVDAAATSGLRAALAQKEAALMRLEGKNFLLAAQVQQLERRCASKGGGTSSGSSLASNHSAHVGPSTEELRLENAKLRGALKKSSDAAAQLARAADALEREKSARRSAEAEARARAEALRAEEARSAGLREERKSAREQIDNLQRKVVELERNLADHDKSFVAELEDHEAEKSSLVAQLEDLQAKAQSERRQLQDKVTQLEAEAKAQAGSSNTKASEVLELLGCPKDTDRDSLVWRQRELLIRLVRRSADLEDELHKARDDLTRRDVVIHNYRVETSQLQVQLTQQQTLQQQLQHQHLQQLQQHQEREQEDAIQHMIAVQQERLEQKEFEEQKRQEIQMLLEQQRLQESYSQREPAASTPQPPQPHNQQAAQDSEDLHTVNEEAVAHDEGEQPATSCRIGTFEERRTDIGIERRPDSTADSAWVSTLQDGMNHGGGSLDGSSHEVLVWPGSRVAAGGVEDIGDEDDNALSLGHSHSVPDLHQWSDDEANGARSDDEANGTEVENCEGTTVYAGIPAASGAIGRLPLRAVAMPHVGNSVPQKAAGASPRPVIGSKETGGTASEAGMVSEASVLSARSSGNGQAMGSLSMNGVPTPQVLIQPRR